MRLFVLRLFVFKQKTAYEMRISDWSSDVCSSDLHVSIVVIDSLNGYLNAMPGEQFLIIQLHELLSFLGQRGIATLMASAHHGLKIGRASCRERVCQYV